MDKKTNRKLNLEYVSNVIGDEYKKWRAGDIVLINAQTGTGKNWFIEEVLLPYVDEDEELFGYAERILYLSNRTNLKREVKQRILKKYNMEIPKTLKELDNITTIGNITISSYHALQQSTLEEIYDNKKSNISSYNYLICDEAHFTLTDGGFNRLNRLTLTEIVKNHYPNAIKIFMSATMDEVENPIKKSIEKMFGEKPKVYEYTTGRDYSYLNVKYFRHRNRKNILSNLIKNDTSDDKWMIFISSIEDGYKLIEELGEDICSMVYANMEETPELNSIINKNEFEKKVLICTKALDNGINIKDPKVKNIVVMALDKTSMIQMIGRKRIDIEDPQEVNLYLSTRSKKTFSTLINGYNPKIKQIELLRKDEVAFEKRYDNNLDEIYGDVIYRSVNTKKYRINPAANARLIKDNDFAIQMVNLFNIDKNFAFIHTQLTWLGLGHTFDESNLIEGVALESKKESMKDYLDNMVGQKLFKDEQQNLIDIVDLRDSRNRQQKSYGQLNEYFKANNLKYMIVPKKSNSIRYWLIINNIA
ncbi:hypothetical protein SDC9_15172 [bioreactor metagenome]|uniref:Type III restriction enzyme, res subunit n=2 Tax=root TaxID=1 RepID=A0A098B3C0_DESHA|nr:DEAD/DEAH box helicase family protein [Desulfitobacterium hafniense]MEA5023924.1 DEAD/DEAH box helicase family protein [Desulfitobacterium hafniense]CDX03334.1 Type III restriction enzyme, res subunit [Desulfitobacterium hafniense]